MKRTFSILGVLIVLALTAALSGPVFASTQAVIPTIAILSVDAGKTVTIQTSNYPANDTFDVLMNYYGTLGVDGTKVDTVKSGNGGAIKFTFNIPSGLKNENLIAIRLQSSKTGYYSYNWFVNQSAGVPNTGGQVPAGTIPTFSITSVDTGKTVSIETKNFPKNDSFDVLIGKFGTLGIGGTKVKTINSSAASEKFTFDIPGSLKNEKQLAIRLQSSKSGYYSYNWFWNNTSTGETPGVPTTGGLPAGTIPTISIVSVEAGKSVTVQTNNYPKDDTFDVYMNYYGTLGKDGVKVETVKSGNGGTMKFTFNIPDKFKNENAVAIRLQSPNSGYFSYNWFWNTSASTPGVPTTGNPSPSLPLGVVPTITIEKVTKDGTVTVRTSNFPANDTFDVYMNNYGTLGKDGVKVDTVNTDKGGSLTFTFNVPDKMKGKDRIAIRLQSSKSGYYSFNWFWNTNAP